MNTQLNSRYDSDALAGCAKGALERVCSGAGLDPASRYYSAAFVDHVNGMLLRGFGGIEQSVGLYKRLLSDLSITVEEQWVAQDRVTSRFVVRGVNRGRRVEFHGITMSRFENGLIVEDWSVVDTLSMLRQLGLVRAVFVSLKALPELLRASGARASAASE